jgi:hypothetical protein
MPIITLTSDWGLRDYFLAVMKGKILSRLPSARIVDISHEISPFNLKQASFILRNSYPFYPAGTVHIVSLLSEASEKSPNVAILIHGQYFIGTDNGIFSLVFDSPPDIVVKLGDAGSGGSGGFPARDVFVNAALHLASGGDIHGLGPDAGGWNEQLHLNPVVSGDVIRGVVIYVNRYENVVTNISRALFEKTGRGRNCVVEFRGETLREIARGFQSVPVGEIAAVFGSTGYLEIAINQGNASSLLGLEVNDPVRVEFKG